MAFCSVCGAQIADGTTACAACAGRVATAPPVPQASASTGGMTDNVAGMLAYVTIIPAIIFLVMEPYNKNRFVRFHSCQNLFFAVAWIVLWIALSIIAHIPIIGLAHHLDLAADRPRGADPLGHPSFEGEPGPDVEAARDRRHGGKASERDVEIEKPFTTKDTKSHEGNAL